jgi:carboxylesterase type B
MAFAQEVKKDYYPKLDPAQMTKVYSDETALPGGNNSKWWWAAKHAGSDATMICTARWSANWAARTRTDENKDGGKAWLFSFEHTPEGPSGQYPQLAHHSSEIPFVFHVLEAHGPSADEFHIAGAAEVKLSAAMARYWINFASSGDPNKNIDRPEKSITGASGVPTWPAYHNASDEYLLFGEGAEISAVAGRYSSRCEFWDELGP